MYLLGSSLVNIKIHSVSALGYSGGQERLLSQLHSALTSLAMGFVMLSTRDSADMSPPKIVRALLSSVESRASEFS